MFRKEDLVFSYTDEQAVADGVLVVVRGAAPYPINRATRAVWDAFTQPMGRLPGALGSSPVTDTTRFSRLADEVGRRIKDGDLQEGWVIMEHEGHRIWAMPNGTTFGRPPYDAEGWTIMFPEDY